MNTLKKNFGRHALQIGVILLITGFILKIFGGETTDVEAYCPLGGLEALTTYLHTETLACSMSVVQITMGITLALCVIFFSKLFCGYVCPLGTLSEWLGKWGKQMKINYTVPGHSWADKILRIIKYVLLFWIFYMTLSSSELFCKNFDPYYSLATGFQGEITLWMSIISLALLLAGSIVIRMFWCKYICPLGALSHIFKFTLTLISIVLLTLLINFTLQTHLSLLWPLGLCCILSYCYEILRCDSKPFPLLRIVRNEEACNQCGACNKHCPQNISIAQTKQVRDVDCTLCGECIASCRQEALEINGKKSFRRLPVLLVLFLFLGSLWMSRHWELPTIDEHWGNPAKRSELVMFEKEGMRTVKCYGSSKAFSAKMQQVPGVYGVTTYVGRFAVQVYYDPRETTREKVEEAMFTPTKRKLQTPPVETDRLKVINLGVENLFDRMDIVYLGNIIRNHSGFYGIVSEYGCPVKIKLYTDIDKPIDKKELQAMIETPEYQMPQAGGTFKTIACNYRLISLSEKTDTIGRLEFLKEMFPAFKSSFRENDAYTEQEIGIYEIEYPELDLPMYQNFLPYFANFLSTQTGILALETTLKTDIPVIRITYVKPLLSDETLEQLLQSPQWTIHYSDGSTEDIKAAFQFPTLGKTRSDSLTSNPE